MKIKRIKNKFKINKGWNNGENKKLSDKKKIYNKKLKGKIYQNKRNNNYKKQKDQMSLKECKN